MPQRRKTERAIQLPDYEPADIRAIQALAGGTADAQQQQRAFNWIVHKAAATYDFAYRETDRDTFLALGRQLVGQQIIKLLHLNAAKFTPSQKPTEQG